MTETKKILDHRFNYITTNVPQKPFPKTYEDYEAANEEVEWSPYYLDGAMDGVTKEQWEALERYFPNTIQYAKRIRDLNYTEFDHDANWVPTSPIRHILHVALQFWAGDQQETMDGIFYHSDEEVEPPLREVGSKYWPEDLKEIQKHASNGDENDDMIWEEPL